MKTLSIAMLAAGLVMAPAVPAAAPDGAHDFDWEIGTWHTHVRRLLHPLTGSNTWGEYDGTSVIRKVWDGKANLVELEVEGPVGHLELASWRLYDPDSHQWSLNVASSRGGGLGVPTVGGFKGSRGEFYDHETWGGKPIVVRFVITQTSADAAHFEQAFSADDGKTWELNWIADDTRIKGAIGPGI
ncbi:MAG TPA: hypothetical protein VGH91_05330 [Gammaproteobacteria bacterium]|jgi:hypothetical protein